MFWRFIRFLHGPHFSRENNAKKTELAADESDCQQNTAKSAHHLLGNHPCSNGYGAQLVGHLPPSN
jgi:hypothetical protein